MEANRGTPQPVSRIRCRRYLRRRRGRRLELARSNSETTVRSSSVAIAIPSTPTPTQTITTPSPLECNNNIALHIAPELESTDQCHSQSSSNEFISLPGTSCIDQTPSFSTPETIIEEPTTLSANPVRVLFRDQQQQLLSTNQSTNVQSDSTNSLRGLASAAQVEANPIVIANRRFIERQIEAIQMADSYRWNFDFQNCRPLAQTGHRYIHCTSQTLRNCRPLNDQNQSAATRFNSNQQQCRLPANQGDCQQRSDHKQQKDG